MRRLAVVVTLSLLSGCAGPTTPQHYGRHWLKDPRMDAWARLDEIKAKVNRRAEEPRMQEQEGCGTMFVWNHRLSGGPGWEFLRVSYTYKNTSESKFDMVRVWVEVLDADGKVASREEEVLMDPLGYALAPGDTYSDVLRVPTKSVHHKDGWSWRIGCEPILMKVLPPKRFGD